MLHYAQRDCIIVHIVDTESIFHNSILRHYLMDGSALALSIIKFKLSCYSVHEITPNNNWELIHNDIYSHCILSVTSWVQFVSLPTTLEDNLIKYIRKIREDETELKSAKWQKDDLFKGMRTIRK